MRHFFHFIRPVVLGAILNVSSATAAVITFDTLISEATSQAFDADGDTTDDVVFSTVWTGGFNLIGPGPNMTFVDEPGLESPSGLNPDPDLRVDFLHGAVGSLRFGFALSSIIVDPAYFGAVEVFDAGNNLIGAASVMGEFTTTPGGASSSPEGFVTVLFPGTAAYATFDFESQFGRFMIDNFEGDYGSLGASVPEPGTWVVFGSSLILFAASRRRRCCGPR